MLTSPERTGEIPPELSSPECQAEVADIRVGVGVGVCIVNYFSADMVERLVSSLRRNAGEAGVVVSCVDNSQSDDEFAALREVKRRVQDDQVTFLLWRSPVNSGYATGNNVAAAALVGHRVRTLVIANPDVTMLRGTLEDLDRFVSGHPGVICTATTWCGRMTYSGMSLLNRWTSVSRPAPRDHRVGALRRGEVSYPGGHFLAMSMATWLRLGGLSEDFFLYGEEADMSVRALRQNLPVLATDAVEVIHEMGGTTGATVDLSKKSPVVLREAARSAVVFSRKHNLYRTPVVVAFRLGLALLVLRRQGPAASREVLRGIIRGLRASLAAGIPELEVR